MGLNFSRETKQTLKLQKPISHHLGKNVRVRLMNSHRAR
jgi:hypothetical protein